MTVFEMVVNAEKLALDAGFSDKPLPIISVALSFF